MQRSAALVPLARDHHAALIMARRAGRAAPDAAIATTLADFFERELAPHFAMEESRLLPALVAHGAPDAAARVRDEHAALRALAVRLRAGEATAAAAFGAALTAHVRYEDRELFPLAERLIPAAALASAMLGG